MHLCAHCNCAMTVTVAVITSIKALTDLKSWSDRSWVATMHNLESSKVQCVAYSMQIREAPISA